MVKPTQPKELKPKAESGESTGKGVGDNRMIVMNAITTVLVCIIFLGANYFIQDSLLASKLKNFSAEAHKGDSAKEDEEAAPERGLILDLGEFILNLSDIKLKRYLKVNVALELTKLESDNEAAKSGGGHGGHGGESAADPAKAMEQKFSQFKPAIRDAIISTLSSKTAEELQTTAGKELAKDQITEAVNAVFDGEREVLRVSFGNFIIQ